MRLINLFNLSKLKPFFLDWILEIKTSLQSSSSKKFDLLLYKNIETLLKLDSLFAIFATLICAPPEPNESITNNIFRKFPQI